MPERILRGQQANLAERQLTEAIRANLPTDLGLFTAEVFDGIALNELRLTVNGVEFSVTVMAV